MEREQPQRAIGTIARRGLDELLGRGIERERELFDAFAQIVPRGEPVLACHHRLRVVQREAAAREGFVGCAGECRQDVEACECGDIVRTRGLQQVLRLPLELFEIRTLGKLPVRHVTSMLRPAVRKLASTETTVRIVLVLAGGLSPSRGPAGAPERSKNRASGRTRSQARARARCARARAACARIRRRRGRARLASVTLAA